VLITEETIGAVTAPGLITVADEEIDATGPVALTTVPPRISVRMALPPLRFGQRAIRVRPAIAIELPQVADLGQLGHVQIPHDHFVLGVRGRVTDQLPPRVD